MDENWIPFYAMCRWQLPEKLYIFLQDLWIARKANASSVILYEL